MSLPMPRYVIDEDRPTEVTDRWEKSSNSSGYAFNAGADARHFARQKNDEFTSMQIVYRNARRNDKIESRPIIPLRLFYAPNGTEHHPVQPGWFLNAIALDRGEPGDVASAKRDFPLVDILAWDV
jgi:hypothetical protein